MSKWEKCFGKWGCSYEVSSLGEVRSRDREIDHNGRKIKVKGKILSQRTDARGYKLVNLSCKGKATTIRVPRLVALAFLGPRPKDHQIDHIDGVKSNNAVYNIEYVSAKENIKRAIEKGLIIPVTPTSKLSICKAKSIRIALKLGFSGRELGRMYGVHESTISAIKHNRLWRRSK